MFFGLRTYHHYLTVKDRDKALKKHENKTVFAVMQSNSPEFHVQFLLYLKRYYRKTTLLSTAKHYVFNKKY